MNKENDMEKKNKKGSLADRIPHQVWLLISFAAAMALWTLLSVIPATSRAFPNVFKVLGSIKTMIDRGVLWNDISSSLISVVSGYALGFVIALPVAILMAWYFGMEGGHALARVLFGDVNPSGKMPLTTPKDEAQLPDFDEFADRTEYGPYHGYTLFDRKGYEPAFPFGYGLSYTTYEYGNLEVLTPKVSPDGRVEVRVDVTNSGKRAGEEVVQLYVGFSRSKVERPVKLLRGFDKVPLAPGETKAVTLSVPVKDLAWFNPETSSWQIEPMTYEVLVGPSSRREDLLKGTFTVDASASGV